MDLLPHLVQLDGWDRDKITAAAVTAAATSVSASVSASASASFPNRPSAISFVRQLHQLLRVEKDVPYIFLLHFYQWLTTIYIQSKYAVDTAATTNANTNTNTNEKKQQDESAPPISTPPDLFPPAVRLQDHKAVLVSIRVPMYPLVSYPQRIFDLEHMLRSGGRASSRFCSIFSAFATFVHPPLTCPLYQNVLRIQTGFEDEDETAGPPVSHVMLSVVEDLVLALEVVMSIYYVRAWTFSANVQTEPLPDWNETASEP